jgi:tetratricopeptide (TPR) repeat protein
VAHDYVQLPERLAVQAPKLDSFYQQYLVDHDAARFVRWVQQWYTVGTLERLVRHPARLTRRGAVLALGLIGDYGSNSVLGQALNDEDRGVRLLADQALRSVWCRAGSERDRQQIALVIRLNTSRQFEAAILAASELIARAPWFAEAWNQRAIAYYSTSRYEESISDCREALELNPYHFGAAAGMGQCYMQLANPRAALECFRQALALNPDLEGVRANVVQLERALGQGK